MAVDAAAAAAPAVDPTAADLCWGKAGLFLSDTSNLTFIESRVLLKKERNKKTLQLCLSIFNLVNRGSWFGFFKIFQ